MEGGNKSEPTARWLNRSVTGMGAASFLSDTGHEMATTVLPAFLVALGAPVSVLGLIEGLADALSSFVKLAAGWYGDRVGRRKSIVVGGYALTGVGTGLLALAGTWPFVLFARALAWIGRGVRGPLRDAMLAESVPKESRGKAFGFHRAGDTAGAVLGPLVGVGILALAGNRLAPSLGSYRLVFALSVIPGLLSAAVFLAFVLERRRPPERGKRLWLTVRSLPRPYVRLLTAVGLNGLGNFAPTLLILAATQLLSERYGVSRAAQIAGLLYVLHNVFYAGMAYPVGALSDRWGRRSLLALGYFSGGLVAAGLVVAFLLPFSALLYLALLFALNGSYMATQDALEGAITADQVRRADRGTAYGLMATVNGIGDFAGSSIVGLLWTLVSPLAAFSYAAALMWAGAGVLARIRRSAPYPDIEA